MLHQCSDALFWILIKDTSLMSVSGFWAKIFLGQILNCSYLIILIICRNFWNAFIKRCLSFRSRLQLFAVCLRMRLYTTLATTPDTSLGYLASTKWNQTCQPVWNYLFSPKYGAHFPAKIQKLSSKSNVVFSSDWPEFQFFNW